MVARCAWVRSNRGECWAYGSVREPPSGAKLASPLASAATYGFFIVLFAKKKIDSLCTIDFVLIWSSRFSI
jgi:hypothetical protein